MFPIALIAGCPAESFWHEDPKVFWAYCRAYKKQQENAVKAWQLQTNTSAWIQGQYLMLAIDAMFSKGNRYPEKPIEIFRDDSAEINRQLPQMSRTEIYIQTQTEKIRAYFEQKQSFG